MNGMFKTAVGREIGKFGIAGVLANVIYFILFYAQLAVYESLEVIAMLSYYGSAIFAFYFQRNYVFETRRGQRGALLRYFILHSVSAVLSTGLIVLGYQEIGLPLLAVQFVAIVFVSVFNFLSFKYFVF